MQWWCSATGEAWTWAWRGYPGVWLFIGLLASGYLIAVRRTGRSVVTPPPHDLSAWLPYRLWFGTGLLAIWLALDWPIGALGAGYLASVHTVSYILLSLIAPPCLILGIPPGIWDRVMSRPAWRRLFWWAARPWLALAVFNAVLITTHVPEVVDGLMPSQAGALVVDLSWLLGGLLLWWPVMGPPAVVTLSRPLKMAYLFISTLPPILPSAFLTFADYPLYATYELAPRVFDIMTAQQDQQVAGLVMKIVGDLPVWLGFGVVFFRWAKESETSPPPDHPGAITRPVPAHPGR
jgi:putative membrane protein